MIFSLSSLSLEGPLGSRDSELAVKGASFLLASMLAFAKTGNFSYDDGDSNENVKKKLIALLSKTTTLHVHHTFLYISLPSLYDYNGR